MLLKQQTAVENEIDQYLSGACEGIHAMTTVPTDSDNLPELWLFNWTSEEFFAPKKLRDTATYVLRFLTCLAPTVHCVLEGNDVRDLKAHVANMQTQQQSISSYAVDFRVEKHEQVEDGLTGTEYRVTIDDEDWQDIDTPLTMFKLWSIGDSSQPIGVYFPANQCYMSAFTAEKSSGIIIFSNEKTTRIEKWEPLLHSEHNLSFVAEYPSRSVLASFVAKTRSLALLNPDESKIVVLKFNARFSVSHTVVQLDWRKKTSLNGPPTSIVLTDNALAMVDTSGIIQIYDFISRQTCRRVGIAGPADRYHLFTGLGDQMVGCICFDKSSAARVVATAFDDNRSIPTTSPSNMVSSLEIDVTSVADKLFFLNTSSRTLHSCQFNVSVQSHKMRVSSKLNEQSKQDQKADHLLWTWFHMFEKFPVRGLLDEAPVCVSTDHPIKIYVVGSSEDAEDVRCVFRFIQTQLVALNKPLYGRNLEKDIQVLCAPSSQELPAMQTNLVLLGPFLRSLVTLVPLQVCRAENNSLTVLRNGEYHASATSHDRILQATDIARSMRFGMISLLLEAWTGQCCVISSMGKQSTGKSYFLNHLTVSSFAISGGRCTDGLWIGTRFVNSSTMLAVLDFEGLGSFERSEQEDVFLSVLNAAVSSVTIFRLDMRLDKEVDELFRRFQNGMQLIKGGSNLFQGILIMSIKDVNPLDEESVLQEFKAKLGRLVELNDEQNFVSDMYNGSVRINTSPPFRTAGYFDSLAQTEALVRNTFTATRFTGKSFLDCLRLVLAKIIALDWTSMEHSARVMKTNDLYELLPAVLRTGRLISRELALRNTIVSTAWNDLYDIDGKVVSVSLQHLIVKHPDHAYLKVDQTH
ncbi:TPA: hypothetical protein N0F65_003431 [Lagenidium giganteum]|uniref:Guanylate-binding protein N-terminal domain-containing protein n=1 Tax=Lagenidium giganteum TaxID=4803 RepID=A0AAV2YHC8_9STRA|nr:TPA: hypothetical protein N0F65_003431 [Lagenidium giganteum]